MKRIPAELAAVAAIFLSPRRPPVPTTATGTATAIMATITAITATTTGTMATTTPRTSRSRPLLHRAASQLLHAPRLHAALLYAAALLTRRRPLLHAAALLHSGPGLHPAAAARGSRRLPSPKRSRRQVVYSAPWQNYSEPVIRVLADRDGVRTNYPRKSDWPERLVPASRAKNPEPASAGFLLLAPGLSRG